MIYIAKIIFIQTHKHFAGRWWDVEYENGNVANGGLKIFGIDKTVNSTIDLVLVIIYTCDKKSFKYLCI